ncbi:MAG: glycosyltransferase [Spirochaetales bacterium]|nr:glycosyltransferase [Spirochaetales bacterium]
MPVRIDIIIIFKSIDEYLKECVIHCLKLDYRNFTIILLPDEKCDFPVKDERIKIIPTGKATIPVKRNIGIRNVPAHAKLIAFIDSDAFPTVDWLKNCIKYFEDPDIYAVGGPNLTPEKDPLLRRIPGYVMAQKIAFGAGAVRHKIVRNHFSNELPTCNLIVRKRFLESNGFDENLITGEDAKICSDIITRGHKILYAGDVIVFHHRRRLVKPFIHQFFNYGYDKGSLFVDGALKSVYYIAPSLFVLFLLSSMVFVIFFPAVRLISLIGLGLYFIICLGSSLSVSADLLVSPLIAFSVFLGHLSYGSGFLLSIVKRFLYKNGKVTRKSKPNEGIPDR